MYRQERSYKLQPAKGPTLAGSWKLHKVEPAADGSQSLPNHAGSASLNSPDRARVEHHRAGVHHSVEAAPSVGGSLGYRPDIDGLRGVAVLAVLLFHYGVPAVSGGFVGVDVFFVISGYLITRLLVQRLPERIAQARGWLIDFYSRRARRILPALLFILAVALAAGWWLLLPDDYANLGKSAAYASVGLGNLYFYRYTGYFDREAALQPLLHLWSLGVEEQFYLIWPTLLGLVGWCTGGRRAWIGAAVGALTLFAFLYALHAVGANSKAAFYLPQARAWELGLGALVVFLPSLPSRFLAEGVPIAGLALIGYAVFVLTSHDPFPGINALWPCLGAALLVWPRQRPSLVGRLLGMFPLRRTGEISYSLYLWHWPLLVFLRYYDNGREPTGWAMIALGVAAYVLAYLSWLGVERPFRRSRAGGVKVLAISLAAAMAVFVAGAAVHHGEGFPARVPASVLALQSRDRMWLWNCSHDLPFTGLRATDCVFGEPWGQATTHALVWGDSHAEHMAPLIEAATKGQPDSFLLYLPCPAALGGRVQRNPDINLPNYTELCTAIREQGIQILREHPEINLVILSASWQGVSNTIAPPGKPRGGADAVALEKAGVEDLIAATATPGRRFLIIADVPQLIFDPVSCAIAAQSGLLRRRCDGNVEHPSSLFERYQGAVYAALAAIAAARSDTAVVLPGRALCARAACQTYLGAELIYRDSSHFRRDLDERTKRELADLIGLTAALRQPK